MDFGKAIKKLREGYQLQRAGWNGKHQYIELATNISYVNPLGEVINARHDNIGSRSIAFVGTSGVQLGWLASQADMLADDWQIVKSPVRPETMDDSEIDLDSSGNVGNVG